MANPVLTGKTTLRIDLATPTIKFEDSSTYAAQGFTLADVRGCLRITGPAGVFYNNVDFVGSPDINGSVPTLSTEETLPTDVNGDVPKGQYIVEYTVKIGATTYPTKTWTFNYSKEKPTVKIEHEVNLVTSALKSKDVTVYGSNESLARTHVVKYPSTISPPKSDVSSGLDTVEISPLYTKTFVTTISTDVTYLQADGLYIEMTVTGQDDVEVVWEKGLCCIKDCIKNLFDQWKAAMCNGPSLTATILQRKLTEMIGNFMLYTMYVQCGNFTEAQNIIATMKTAVSEMDCCGCDEDNSEDEDVVEITPLVGVPTTSNGNSYNLTTTNNGITVTPNVVGSTTTWQVSLDYNILIANAKPLIEAVATAAVKAGISVVGTTNQIVVTKTVGGSGEDVYTISISPNFSLDADKIEVTGVTSSCFTPATTTLKSWLTSITAQLCAVVASVQAVTNLFRAKKTGAETLNYDLAGTPTLDHFTFGDDVSAPAFFDTNANFDLQIFTVPVGGAGDYRFIVENITVKATGGAITDATECYLDIVKNGTVAAATPCVTGSILTAPQRRYIPVLASGASTIITRMESDLVTLAEGDEIGLVVNIATAIGVGVTEYRYVELQAETRFSNAVV
jgi:hypothetical protein